jgi:glycopeptide antibiotics resistance protein
VSARQPGGGRARGWHGSHAALLWRAAYVAVVVLATVTQIRLPVVGSEVAWRLGRAFNPEVAGRDVIDAARNLVLFAGWGVVWVMTATRGRRRALVVQATLTGLALSALVETAQLFSPIRNSSILDLASNAGGAFAGALGTAALWRGLAARRGTRSYVGIPAFIFAACYGTAVMLEAASPLLRQERYGDAWGSPWRRLGIALDRLDISTLRELPLFDVLLFAPAAFLAVAALAELGWPYRRAAGVVTVVGAAAVAVAELARGLIGFILAYGPIVVHVIALALGATAAAALMPRFTRAARGAERPLALFTLLATLVILWNGRPFSFEPSLEAIARKVTVERFIPIQAYRERFDLHTAADAVIPALLFLPIGALLAAWPLRRRGPWHGIIPGIVLACIAEGLQVIIAGRTFDVTDILIMCGALGIGFLLARRAGFRPYGDALDGLRERRPAPAAARPS